MNQNVDGLSPPPGNVAAPAAKTSVVRILPLIAAALFLFGGIFMAIGVFAYMKASRLVNEGVSASGIVTAIEERWSSSSNNKGSSSRSLTYYPRFRFTDASGHVHEVTSNFGTSPPSHSVGDAVNIRYLPSDPNGATIDSWVSLWLFPTVFIGVSFLPEIAGVILLVIWARKRRAAATRLVPAAGDLPQHSSLQERLERNRG